jgi:glycine cleavage system aminomethyltransferase T/glycine/D-amino acid oxidase-like deaminating enzyme
MRDQARVVIIGAGIVGCSTAYYLTQMGWNDICVLDQGPLFENLGSTSHAPGLMFQHNNSKTVCQLAKWSVELYGRVAPINPRAFFQVGSLEIAHTRDRWEELKRKLGNAKSWALEAFLIGADEIKQMIPIMRTDDLYGAFYVPSDCDVKASLVCAALIDLAQRRGANFYANTSVAGIEVRNGRVQAVNSSAGRIRAEYVICAAGIWGPLIGRMARVSIPLTPVQHLYVKTAPLRELAGEVHEVRHPIVRYQDKDLYFRQHTEAYGFGSYRHDPLLVDSEALPQNDHPAVFPFTPEYFKESMRDAAERFPCLGQVELVQKFNGLFSFTPDGNSILGETPDVRGFWVAEAVWVTHGGGAGRALAEWIVEGSPSLDLREVDITRFHPYSSSRSYIKARAARQYIEVYDIIHPLQQMESPRRLRLSPFHTRLEELGAVFFESAGWERAQWFTSNEKLKTNHEWPSRSGWTARYWSPIIGAEHYAARSGVALFDLTPFTKLEVGGSGALDFLQYLASNQIDQPTGRVIYTSMLNECGGIKCDLTVTRLAADRFLVVTGGSTGMHDLAWIRSHLPEDGRVHVTDLTSRLCCIGVWGPQSRQLLQTVSDSDFSNEGFPYLTAQPIHVGSAPALAVRISYVGELGWEVYAPTEYGLGVWDILWQAGQSLGVVAAGGGAFDSLRLEKGYRLWGNEIHSEYNPYEAGLSFAVKLDKGEFLGRSALERVSSEGIKRKLCCLTFDDPTALVMGKEPILQKDRVLGYVTSANYGYTVQRSILYGYLPIEEARLGTQVEVYFFGRRHGATLSAEPLYDPKNVKLKT